MANPLGKTLRGYLRREIIARFVAGLALFTFVLFTARIIEMVDLVLARGVPAATIARLFLLVLPTLFELTTPVAVLMATIVTFGRLKSDGELTALRAAGLSWLTLVGPAVRCGALAAIACFAVAAWLRPWANERIAEGVYELAKARAGAALKPGVFNSDFDGIVLYIEEVESETGQVAGILLADERDHGHPTTVLAAAGRVIADEPRRLVRLELSEGTSLTRHGARDSYDVTAFASFDVTLDLGARWPAPGGAKDPSQLALGDLLGERRAAEAPRAREAEIELHRKLAFALASVVFGVLGVPLGVAGAGGARGRGLTASVASALLYYFVFGGAVALARQGSLPPALVLQLPNTAFALAACLALGRQR